MLNYEFISSQFLVNIFEYFITAKMEFFLFYSVPGLTYLLYFFVCDFTLYMLIVLVGSDVLCLF